MLSSLSSDLSVAQTVFVLYCNRDKLVQSETEMVIHFHTVTNFYHSITPLFYQLCINVSILPG